MYLVVARVGAPHGIHGNLKLQLFLEDPASIHDFHSLFIKYPRDKAFQALKNAEISEKGNQFYIHFENMNDRDQVRVYTHAEIAVLRSELPALEEGRFYWDDLLGLSVWDLQGKLLGTVESMMETGANDVIVVKTPVGAAELIPYVQGHIVKNIDLMNKKMIVDWET